MKTAVPTMQDRCGIDVSVIAPVYGCSSTVETLVSELVDELEALELSFEIVLVDDRSPDDVWAKVLRLGGNDSRVVGVRLSRNFGRDAAVTAGLEHARGAIAVMMDGDLQDPPSEVSHLLAAADEVDIVLTRRIGSYEARHRRLLSSLYFRVCSLLSGERIDPRLGGFILMRRKAVDAYLKLEEVDRNVLFVVKWLGFESVVLDYERVERVEGETSFGLGRRLATAGKGLLFQTTRFLLLVVLAGFLVATLGGLLGLYVIFQALRQELVPGWASTMSVLLMMFGIVIFVQGIIGIYVGRIFEYSKARPLYFVDEILGGETGGEDDVAGP